jgi:hypothetical protein
VVAGIPRAEAAVAVAATLLLGACALVGDVLHGPRDRVVFAHVPHMKANAKSLDDCSTCHFATPKDVRGEEPLLPSEASCLACHGDWKKNGECSKCHTDADAPKTWAPSVATGTIKFSHARHLERVARLEDRACESCHANVYDEGHSSGAVRVEAEAMDRWHEACFKCHLMRTEWDRMNCGKCHRSVSDVTGPRPASRFNHGPGWLEMHGNETLGRPGSVEVCARCHDRGFCTECHDARNERRVRPEIVYPDRPDRAFIHRGDYVNRHFLEARADPSTCLRCHGTPFCIGCHEQRGLTPTTRKPAQTSDRTAPNGQQIVPFHQGTFAELNDPRSPFFHGKTARRDAALCASCHDEGPQSSCIACHAVQGVVQTQKLLGGNPHPDGFKSPISKSSRACRGCHGG